MFTPPGNWWKKLPFQSPVRPGCWGNPCVESTAAHRGNVTHLNQCNKENILSVSSPDGHGLTSLYMFCSFSFSSGFMPADTFSTVRRQTSLFSPSVTILHNHNKAELFFTGPLIQGNPDFSSHPFQGVFKACGSFMMWATHLQPACRALCLCWNQVWWPLFHCRLSLWSPASIRSPSGPAWENRTHAHAQAIRT